MNKKLLVSATILAALLGLAACSGKGSENGNGSTSTSSHVEVSNDKLSSAEIKNLDGKDYRTKGASQGYILTVSHDDKSVHVEVRGDLDSSYDLAFKERNGNEIKFQRSDNGRREDITILDKNHIKFQEYTEDEGKAADYEMFAE